MILRRLFSLGVFGVLLSGVYFDIKSLIDLYSVYVFVYFALAVAVGAMSVYVITDFDLEEDKSLFKGNGAISMGEKGFTNYNKFVSIPILIISVFVLIYAGQVLTASALIITIAISSKVKLAFIDRFEIMRDHLSAKSSGKVIVVDFRK